MRVEERYRDLVALISEHDFEFLDTFGELSESESVLPNFICYFTSQNEIFNASNFEKSPRRWVNQTLFRSNNLPAQLFICICSQRWF